MAIVDLNTFERAQEFMADSQKRSATKNVTANRYTFTGMIRCPYCGKNYKRKVIQGTATWNCATYLDFGKSACFGKTIPENTLMALMAEVFGLPIVNAQVLRDFVDELVVPEPNKFVYAMTDGRQIERI